MCTGRTFCKHSLSARTHCSFDHARFRPTFWPPPHTRAIPSLPTRRYFPSVVRDCQQFLSVIFLGIGWYIKTFVSFAVVVWACHATLPSPRVALCDDPRRLKDNRRLSILIADFSFEFLSPSLDHLLIFLTRIRCNQFNAIKTPFSRFGLQ